MIRLAYILAASHSGSTLLAMMLNAHPQVCSVGELKLTHLGDVGRYRCSCGSLISACPFWVRIARDMVRRGRPFDIAGAGTDQLSAAGGWSRLLLRPLHRGPLLEKLRDLALSLSPQWCRRLPEIQDRNAALMAAILEARQARWIVDSSKIGLRLKYHLRNPQLDVRVIRLIRDGRGVALSYIDPAGFADARDPQLRAGGCGGDRRDERQSLGQAARQWRRSNEEAEHILRGVDRVRWIEVRYEDLCRDPRATMGEICSFLEVDPAAWRPDFKAAEHHVVGNGMRLDGGGEVRLDDRWRAVLQGSDMNLFETIAGEMIRRYGYDV
jgi:hypothetical protein